MATYTQANLIGTNIDPIELEINRLLPTYRIDTRTIQADMFEDITQMEWANLTWDAVGRPVQVNNFSKHRDAWEAEHSEEMPVQTQWAYFNQYFHQLFVTNLPEKRAQLFRQLLKNFGTLHLGEAIETFQEMMQITVWNNVHRAQDAVWDPRGKRALFEGLDVEKPEILFLGAADGYEAMQLMAMYPGGHAVLVDYDDFCRTDRFGKFPERYPFVGKDVRNGNPRIWYKDEMNIDFEVVDIRDLKYGREFDVVVSIGLVEHFPDEYKHVAIDFHRRFLKRGGYAIFTTPRQQVRSKLFYTVMGDIMNFGYRELMTPQQLGLYVYENGFDILRAGYIKAHNGIIAKER